MTVLIGTSDKEAVAGVSGSSTTFNGVIGYTTAKGHAGVAGVCDSGEGNGVYGRSGLANGVIGYASGEGGCGVVGDSKKYNGVLGITHTDAHSGVAGICESPSNGNGVLGHARGAGVGVYGLSEKGTGVFGTSKSGRAGFFHGDVEVTGDIILSGADVAEQFDISEVGSEGQKVLPGSVVVLDDQGRITLTSQAYDHRVAGIVSGAGDRKPALVLDRHHPTSAERQPLAVVGKAWCLADATDAPIAVGDILTTSTRPGHARRATPSIEAIGSLIGKALTPLAHGTGTVLVLVGLG